MSDRTSKTSTQGFLNQGVWGYTQSGIQNPKGALNGSSKTIGTVTSTFNGVKNPHWERQVSAHTSATTTASGTRKMVQQGKVGQFQADWWTSSSAVGNYYSTNYHRRRVVEEIAFGETEGLASVPAPSLGSLTTADNRAIDKLYERIHSIESSVLGGEDLGEIHQTVRLLKSPMKELRYQINYLLDLNQRAWSQNSKSRIVAGLGSTILEYRFGVVPLTHTIASALVGLQNRDYLGHYYPISARGTDANVNSGTFTKGGIGGRSVNVACTHEKSVSVWYNGEYGVRASTDRRSVSDVLRLRFRDVVPTLWNLLPWSWLADYATNVGTIAEQFSIDWSDIRWMNRTVRNVDRREYQVLSWFPINPSYGKIETVSPCHSFWDTTSFTRTKQYEQPRPKLEIDFRLNGGRLLNIAAAIATRVPLLDKLRKKAVRKHPDLPSAFADMVGRRKERIPYPFHISQRGNLP